MSRQTDGGVASGDADDARDDDKLDKSAARGADDSDHDFEDDGDVLDDQDDEPTLEELAIEAGWAPKSQWKGDPSKHVGPAEYLRRMANSSKTLRVKVRDKDRELEEVQRRIKRLESATETTRQREFSDIRARADRQLELAIESGDKKRIREATKYRDQVFDELADELAAEEVREPSDDEIVEQIIANTPHMTVQKPFWREHAWLLDDDDDEGAEAFAEVEEIITDIITSKVGRGDPKTGKGPRRATVEEFEQAFAAAERHLKRVYGHRLAGDDDEEDEDLDKDKDRTGDRRRNGQFKPKRDEGGRPQRRVPVLSGGNRSRGRDYASRLSAEDAKIADAEIKAGNFADRNEFAKVMFREMGEKVDD